MIGFLITMLVIGIIAGYLARLLVPGRDPMGFIQPSGILGSIIGAVLALLVYNAATHRGIGRRI